MTVMLRQTRQAAALAAWGLERDGRGWWRHAACVATPDLHTADLRSGWQTNASPQAMARHICLAHCPVQAQCSASTRRSAPADVVQAGLLWVAYRDGRNATGRPSTVQPPDPGCGPWCEEVADAPPT